MTPNYPYVTCRTFGHRWEPSVIKKREVYGRRVVLECDRCGTIRMDGVAVTGQVITRSYSQPDDYRLTRAQTPTRQEFRKKWLREHG